MSAPERPAEVAVRVALDRLAADYQAAATAVRDAVAEDAAEAFRLATLVAQTVADLQEETKDLRLDTVRAVRDREKLKITALADRIGVSRARAHQFVQDLRRKEAEGDQ